MIIYFYNRKRVILVNIEFEHDTFGDLVKHLRTNSKMGSRELSNKIEKGISYISQIESGRNKKPDFIVSWKILSFLGVEEQEIESLLSKYGIFPPEGYQDFNRNFNKRFIVNSIDVVKQALQGESNDLQIIKDIDANKKHELFTKATYIYSLLTTMLDYNPEKAELIFDEVYEEMVSNANKLITERIVELIEETDDLKTSLSVGRQVNHDLTNRGLKFILEKENLD